MLTSTPLRYFPGASALFAAATLLCLTPAVRAADLHVPNDHPTIQSAIDAASTGDAVLVAPGIFVERIDFLGKDITVQSTGGPEVTTIDAAGLGTTVTFDNGETAAAVLDGFTVTGGSGDRGGGIHCGIDAAGPTLRNLIVSGNTATAQGGGLWVGCLGEVGGNPEEITTTVVDCAFVGNTSGGTFTSGGGAIALAGRVQTLEVRGSTFNGNSITNGFGTGAAICGSGGVAQVLRIANSTIQGNSSNSILYDGSLVAFQGHDVTLVNCRIIGNGARGIYTEAGSLRLHGCEITGNAGEGLWQNGASADAEILNCTIARNGGGIDIDGGDLTLRNSVVWGNTGGNLEVDLANASASISYSNVGGTGSSKNWNSDYGTNEGGNLDKDPCFVDPDGLDQVLGTLDDDFRLGRFARAVDAADNTAVPADVLDLDGDLDFAEPLPLDSNGAPRFVDDVPMIDRGSGSAPFVDMGALERQEDSVPVEWPVGPGESIQAAIDGACPQDVILVAPGVYTEPIDFQGRDVVVRSASGPEVTTIDVSGLGVSAVVFSAGEDEFATLDGFTVTGGSAFEGGGILCRREAAGPTLRNLIVSGNTAGTGGGLWVGCRAGVGSDPDEITTTVVDCTFVGNTSSHPGLEAGGAAIALAGRRATLEVRGSTFNGNSITNLGTGGAIWASGYGQVLRIANSTFQGNSNIGFYGGTLAVFSTIDVTLVNCRINGNTGRGIYTRAGSLWLHGCEIAGNTSEGIRQVLSSVGDTKILNCTIAQNNGGIDSTGGGLTLRNSVVWGNTGNQLSASGALISYSNIAGSGGSSNWNPVFGIDEGGNIDVDPLYASPASGIFSLGAGSPCVDAADNTVVPMDELDLDGDGVLEEPLPFDVVGSPRFVDDPSTVDTGVGPAPLVDMGSFEFQLNPGIPFCFGDPGAGTPCPCNNDNDGTVPGSGCANGAFASGAQLTGSGTARVSADTLVLSTTGLHPNNSGLYFQANNAVNHGDGIVFGDGLRCAGGDVVRLQVRSSDASGASHTTIALGAKGGVSAGDTKRYQCWYRDTSGNQPCGTGVNDFNLSNGYEITWRP